MSIVIGIDGGGSTTRCALSIDGRTAAEAHTAGCNVVRVGEAQARNSLLAAVDAVLREARVAPAQVGAACCGIAGSSVPEVRALVEHTLRERLQCPLEIVGDPEVAFESVLGGGPGVLVIAGTGSIAWAHDAKGNHARAGGHGHVLGDEGSGLWIGRTAMASALRARDAGSESLLLEKMLRAFHAAETRTLVLEANRVPPPDFAALLPMVIEAADEGDAVARAVLTRAGAELAEIALVAARRLSLQGSSRRVAMGGGVFTHAPQVQSEFVRVLKQQDGGCVLIEQLADGLAGAVARASRIARPH